MVSGGSIKIPASGRAIGGRLQAREVIEIGVAGSAQGGDHLTLAVGVGPLKDLEAAKLANQARRAETVQASLEHVREMTDSENEATIDGMLSHQAAKAADSEAKLTEDTVAPKIDCRIQVGRKLYFGVVLQIGRGMLSIDEDRNGGTFRYDRETGEIIGGGRK